MAIKIGSNFTFQGEQPNFERDRFATKAAMKAFPKTSIDDGHLSYCAEDGNTYQFRSSNSVDAVTGKWRIFKDGFGADTISTEPNQFLAGPATTQGNIHLRKIDASDLPDLSSKYGTKAEITNINSNITDLHSSLESTQTDFVDLRNKVNAMPKTVFITQAAYNALTTKDANTIYYING